MTRIAWSAELRSLAERFGDATAVADGGPRTLSYRQLCDRAHGLARSLLEDGVAIGQPVAVLLANSIDSVWVSYGIRLAGAAEVPLSWSYTADEIAWSAQLVPFRTVLTRDTQAGELRAMGLTPLTVDAIPAGGSDELLAPVPAEAASRYLFTSGTTGRPKAVVYDHGGRWLGEQLLRATLPFTPPPAARIVLMTPFPHGASLLTYAWCAYGGEVVLLDGVDLPRVHALLRDRVDALFAPPTVLAKLAGAFGDERFAGVRCVFTGTQALAAPLYAKACAMFGPVVRVTYGKTECVNPITVLAPADVHAYFSHEAAQAGACVGWPAPGVELRIERTGEPETQDAEADGEVWLRARHMSCATIAADGRRPHGPDGWHRTGDLGHIDARGRLVLTGRVADVIKTGGYRVNPAEIESCLSGIAACGEICVTSVASEYWGEVIVAVAEQAGSGWREEAGERVAVLSRHKRPRVYLELPALPRNPQGKVGRAQVARVVMESHELVDGPYPALLPKASPGR